MIDRTWQPAGKHPAAGGTPHLALWQGDVLASNARLVNAMTRKGLVTRIEAAEQGSPLAVALADSSDLLQ